MSDSSEDEYEVEAILDHRYNGPRRQYLVKWLGYDDSNNTWEPLSNLESAKELIDQYQVENIDLLDSDASDSKAAKATSSKHKPTNQPADKHVKGSKASEAITIDNEDTDEDEDDERPLFDTSPKRRVTRLSKKDMDDSASDSDMDWGHNKKRRLRSAARKPAKTYTNVSIGGIDDSEDDSGTDTGIKKNGMIKEKTWKHTLMEMKIDGEQQVLDVIDDATYPGSNTHWENRVNKVIGIFRDDDHAKKRAILLWKNGNHSVHDLEKLHKKCPIVLLQYYESHMTFMNDIKVTEK